jgi:hypothetical protein
MDVWINACGALLLQDFISRLKLLNEVHIEIENICLTPIRRQMYQVFHDLDPEERIERLEDFINQVQQTRQINRYSVKLYLNDSLDEFQRFKLAAKHNRSEITYSCSLMNELDEVDLPRFIFSMDPLSDVDVLEIRLYLLNVNYEEITNQLQQIIREVLHHSQQLKLLVTCTISSWRKENKYLCLY